MKNEYNGYYWLIPTDNRYEKSLDDLNVSSTFKSMMIDNQNVPKNKYIFVGYSKINMIDKWGWNNYKGKLIDAYYERSKYEFKGLVNMDESELDANKYNL